MAWLRAAASACVMVLAGCGGGGDDRPTPTPPTIGVAGGTVNGPDGAKVSFPANALGAEMTVAIAKDGTGAPALPPAAEAAGAVYMITPHGGGFAAHAEVTIPVERSVLAENEQLLLMTASPGDTQWRVLSGASYENGAMRALVAHFSFFRVVVIKDIQVPRLIVSVDNRNNAGNDGMTAMSPDFEFGTARRTFESSAQAYKLRYVAKLRYAPPPINVGILPTPRPTRCAPVSYGRSGANWYFERNGSEPITPDVEHWNLRDRLIDSAAYPRTEADFNDDRDTRGGAGRAAQPGFGAIHFYAQDNPRRGSYVADAALPPANNVIDDDVLTWRGDATLVASRHNGRHRVDVWVPTSCGFSIEAVPLLYQVNLLDTGRFSFWGLDGSADVEAAAGSRATMYFESTGGNAIDPATLRWEFSTDSVNWQARPLPAGVGIDYPAGFDYRRGQLVVNAARPDQTGFYRARACSYSVEGSTPVCIGGYPVALNVVTAAPGFTQHPQGSIVQVGETASFTAVPAGAPAPALQWQKRSIAAAAFNYTAWTNIDGATSNTLTLPPATTNDGATQFRIVATNELGTVASDAALLTVVDRFVTPAITAQPGNLNVVVGGTAVFAGAASGSAPLSYQWLKDGVAITGANTPTLTLNAVAAGNAARYALVVSNRAGQVTSEPATLVVTLGTPVPLAPTIAAPPAPGTVAVGQSAQFAVAVNGTGPYTYLWSRDGVPIPGADGASYLIAAVSPTDAGDYTVRVTNTVGTVLSTAARLTVNAAVTNVATPPAITAQPAGLAVAPGSGATLAIGYTGSGPLTFQWRRDGVDIAGATAAVLHLDAAGAGDAGQYAVTVRNAAGAADSSVARLIVIGAPAISQQPAAATAAAGASTTFAVTATGDSLRYLWLRNGIPVAGATSAQLSTPALTLADNGAAYSVVVFNGAGAAVSNPAVLTVTSADVAASITQQPAAQSGVVGGSATFTIGTAGTPTPDVVWQTLDANNNWVGNGVTGNSLTLSNLTLAQTGLQVRAIVSNAIAVPNGSQGFTVTSNAATLSVAPVLPANALTAAQVVAHAGRALVVRPDGTAWAFGQSTDAATGGYPNTNVGVRPVRVAGLPLVQQVAIGATFNSWALARNGEVWGWGFINSVKGYGQGPANTAVSFPSPVRVLMAPGMPIDRVCHIAGTMYGVVMVRSDVPGGTCADGEARSVWFTGDSISSNEVGGAYATRFDRLGGDGSPGGLPAGRWVVEVFTSRDFGSNVSTVFARANDGAVYAWGYNAGGLLGLGHTDAVTVPTLAPGWQGATRIVATGEATLALMPDGSITGAGNNINSSLGIGPAEFRLVTSPTKLAAPTDATDLSGASSQPSSMALVGGQLRYWGSSTRFATGRQVVPVAIPSTAGPFTAIAVAGYHALAIGPGGAVYAWGDWQSLGCGNFVTGVCDTTPVPQLVRVP